MEPVDKENFDKIVAELEKSKTNPKQVKIHNLTRLPHELTNALVHAGYTVKYIETATAHTYTIVS